jgi:hypothetical protein
LPRNSIARKSPSETHETSCRRRAVSACLQATPCRSSVLSQNAKSSDTPPPWCACWSGSRRSPSAEFLPLTGTPQRERLVAFPAVPMLRRCKRVVHPVRRNISRARGYSAPLAALRHSRKRSLSFGPNGTRKHPGVFARVINPARCCLMLDPRIALENREALARPRSR